MEEMLFQKADKHTRNTSLLWFGLIISLFIACGGTERATTQSQTASYLPDSAADGAITRASEVRVFPDTLLWEYINGGADVYHAYNVVEVATADYKQAEAEVVVDVYRFDTPDNAYGLYTAIRPEDPQQISLGAGGFISETSIDFVKGNFLVKVIGYDQSPVSTSMINTLAATVEQAMPGPSDMPATFGLFPQDGVIETTEKVFAQSFLGQKSLTAIYCQDYAIADDTLTLFLTQDNAEAKLLEWSQQIEPAADAQEVLAEISFDNGKALAVDNNYYGRIIGGLRGTKLAGMINYVDKHRDFMNNWLNSLP